METQEERECLKKKYNLRWIDRKIYHDRQSDWELVREREKEGRRLKEVM